MRTITKTIFTFDELSEEAKEKAIQEMRERYYQYNDFDDWVIDDCALFEPNNDELENIDGYEFPLLKNTRKNIYFSTDTEWYLYCENALIVTNDEHFYKWLGIPEDIYNGEDFSYRIFTPRGRYETTTIDFDGFNSDFGDVIDTAVEKFANLMQSVLKRIKQDIDYRFTDEAIIEDIIANEYEFDKEGNIH